MAVAVVAPRTVRCRVHCFTGHVTAKLDTLIIQHLVHSKQLYVKDSCCQPAGPHKMADTLQCASSLDDYLKKTASDLAIPNKPVLRALPATRHLAKQLQSPELVNAHCDLHDIVGTHRAQLGLNRAAESAAGSFSDASSMQRHSTAATAAGGSRLSAEAQPVCSGVFRAMRQADAAAAYAERFKPDITHNQQTVFPAPADDTNAAVRIISSNAGLQAKLQRLQLGMNAKTYRQQLLLQLQQPAALFQEELQLANIGMFDSLGRGGLSPAISSPVAGRCLQGPTAAYSNEATVHTSRHSSSCSTASTVRRSAHKQAAEQQSAAGTYLNGLKEGLLVSTAAEKLQHLRELAEYEMPWRSDAVQPSRNMQLQDNRPHYHNIQQRPWTASSTVSLSKWPAQGYLSNGNSSSSAGKVAVRLQPAARQQDAFPQHGPYSCCRYTSSRQHEEQQPLQRPASAIAALQQSLSELALLKSRYLEQQKAQHQQHTRGLLCRADQQQLKANKSSNMCQQHCGSTWLPEPSLQHIHAASGPDVYTPGDQDGIGLFGSAGLRQRPASVASFSPKRHRTPSPSYHIWDAWQQQIHGPTAAAPTPVARTGKNLGYSSHVVWASPIRRTKSAPRGLWAWDRVQVSTSHSVQLPSYRLQVSPRQCRLQQQTERWRQQRQQLQQQQEWQRPKTAGVPSTQQTKSAWVGLGGTRVTHCTTLHSMQQQPQQQGIHSHIAAAAAASHRPVGNRSSSAVAWLASSPLRRTHQQVVAAAGSPDSSGSRLQQDRPEAAGRARAVAALLSQDPTATADAAQPPVAAAPAASAALAHVNGPSRLCKALVSQAAAANASSGPSSGPSRVNAVGATAAELLQRLQIARHTNGQIAIAGNSTGCTAAAARLHTAQAVPVQGAGAGPQHSALPLTQHMLKYATARYISSPAQQGTSVSSPSSITSESDSTSSQVPAYNRSHDRQAAYAAVLARVRKASRAAQA